MLLNPDSSKNRWSRSLYPLLSFTIPLLLYAAVLVMRVPNEIAMAVRSDFTTVVIAIANKYGRALPQLEKDTGQEYSSQFLLIFSLILAGFVFVAPLTTKVFSRAPQFANISCNNGTEAAYFRLAHGSSFTLVADDATRQTHLPQVRISDFRDGILNLGTLYPDLAKGYAPLSPSTTIMNSVNLKDLQLIWLIADSNKIPKGAGIVGVCQKVLHNRFTQSYGFF